MIYLSSALFSKLIAQIQATTEESCGFLLGSSSLDENKIELFFNVPNNSKGDRSKLFEISVQDYKLAEEYVAVHGLVLLGIYHTHINHPPLPSKLDRKFAFPEFHYLIISLVDFSYSEVKCWKINRNRKFIEIGIKFNK